MNIGELTLAMIGTARVRTEYEGAMIEGLVTDLELGVTRDSIVDMAKRVHRDVFDVTVALSLGNIRLQGLRRSHPCEVVS